LFADSPDITTDPNINRTDLDDLGVIYYHLYQAWKLSDRVNQALDFQLPVEIIAFSTQGGVFWLGPNSRGANPAVDPFISIEAPNGKSVIADGGRPDNREWHEFGHHVMADTLGNLIPDSPGDSNHNGYANPSTTDSWTEGFAEFYSMMVAREVAKEPRPELYHVNGREINLEANRLAWGRFEELAVAGLLWDLVDAVDADDATVMTPTTGIPITLCRLC